jgi:antitoxin component YwqK of YwqJK toxin-antitoxin module
MNPRTLPLMILVLAACGNGPGTPPAATQATDSTHAVAATADTLRDGHQQVRDRNGLLLMEGDVRNGVREGLWTAYHPNGAVASRNEYRNGMLHGLTVTLRPNGALYYRGQHANGHPVGTWEFHDAIGTLVRTITYDSAGVEVRR